MSPGGSVRLVTDIASVPMAGIQQSWTLVGGLESHTYYPSYCGQWTPVSKYDLRRENLPTPDTSRLSAVVTQCSDVEPRGVSHSWRAEQKVLHLNK